MVMNIKFNLSNREKTSGFFAAPRTFCVANEFYATLSEEKFVFQTVALQI